jgi:hypothetical protein
MLIIPTRNCKAISLPNLGRKIQPLRKKGNSINQILSKNLSLKPTMSRKSSTTKKRDNIETINSLKAITSKLKELMFLLLLAILLSLLGSFEFI